MKNYYSLYKNDFKIIQELYQENLLNKPYLVGGAVRDCALGISSDAISDLDITTLSSDCVRLGILYSIKKNKMFKMFKDYHITIIDDLKNIDFSSSVVYNNVVEWVKENNPEKIKYLESYSRDFTINSMHQDFFSEKIYDPTEMGLADISRGIIRTPCPAQITLSNDKRRIFRAINLAVRFGMDIHEDIINYSLNVYSIDEVEDDFSRSSEINEVMLIDPDKTFDIILRMGLYKKIPLVGPYKEYIISKNLLIDYMSWSSIY